MTLMWLPDFLLETFDPEIPHNKTLHREVLATYQCWRAGGHTPYEYLFKLPRNHLEVDYAVLKVGYVQEEKEFEEEKENLSTDGQNE